MLLTLNLPSAGGGGGGGVEAGGGRASGSDSSAPPSYSSGVGAASDSAGAAPRTPGEGAGAISPPPPPLPPAIAASSGPEPMDLVDLSNDDPPTAPCSSPAEALDLLLKSNFDSDSRACVLTLLKLLDNVLSKPGDDKVRAIRLSNPAFERRVGCRRGGMEFLLSVGFRARPNLSPLLSGPPGVSVIVPPPGAEFIDLAEEREDHSLLLEARRILVTGAVNVLGMGAGDLPRLSLPPPLASEASHNSGRPSSDRRGGEFNPYRTQSYNTQAAAAAGSGADPSSVTPGSDGYVSKTERRLSDLKERQARLEKKMQTLGGGSGAGRREAGAAMAIRDPTKNIGSFI